MQPNDYQRGYNDALTALGTHRLHVLPEMPQTFSLLIDVAFTYYPPGGEHTQWFKMPVVPRVGETVHLPIETHGEPDSRAFQVTHVSWALDDPNHPGWHAEIGLS